MRAIGSYRPVWHSEEVLSVALSKTLSFYLRIRDFVSAFERPVANCMVTPRYAMLNEHIDDRYLASGGGIPELH